MRSALDPAINGALGAYRGYLRLFTASPLAPVLSPSSPVRLSGFDQELTVTGHEKVSDDVVAMTLRGTGDLPAWTPGAHLDVFLPSGVQRQYSLCGDRFDRGSYRIAVRRIQGGSGSQELHDELKVGDRLRVRGPRNAFHLAPESSYLFVAGGIGITPILPMVAEAQHRGLDWTLVYLGRSRDTMPFLDELAAYGHRVVVRTDEEHGLPDPRDLMTLAPQDGAVYFCGPVGLHDQAKALVPKGVRFYSERFSAPPVRGGEEFTVELARTGRTVTVAADESLLSALRREVPGTAYSCQQGFCGTCRTPVISGGTGSGSLLPCVDRATGTLVLEA